MIVSLVYSFEAQALRHPATCLVLRAETLTGISPSLKLVASDSKRIQTIAHGISNGQFENSETALDLICSKCSKCNKLTNQLLWDTLVTI